MASHTTDQELTTKRPPSHTLTVADGSVFEVDYPAAQLLLLAGWPTEQTTAAHALLTQAVADMSAYRLGAWLCRIAKRPSGPLRYVGLHRTQLPEVFDAILSDGKRHWLERCRHGAQVVQ